MDTLTHALSGAVAGRLFVSAGDTRAARRPTAWQAMAVGGLAAAFPDADWVLGYVSELAYLRGHRGVTHSLILLPLWGLLVAWIAARSLRMGGGDRAAWRMFYPIACAGILIHIAGDVITQFGTMILAPFSDQRFGLSTTFIIDLVFTGILVAGLLASALFRRSRVPAALALVALAGWVGVGWMGRTEAIAAAREYAESNGVAMLRVDAAPRPASPFNWTAIVFDGAHYHYAHINTRRTEPLRVEPGDGFLRRISAPYQPVHEARWRVAPRFGDESVSAFAQRVWENESFDFFRWFAMFPVLEHADGRCAWFADLRFLVPGREHLPFRYGMCRRTDGADEGDAWRLYALDAEGRRPVVSP